MRILVPASKLMRCWREFMVAKFNAVFIADQFSDAPGSRSIRDPISIR